MTEDPDTLRDQWHDVQANDAHLEFRQTINYLVRHRCPPDMPPCPDCQEREEEENFKEFGP